MYNFNNVFLPQLNEVNDVYSAIIEKVQEKISLLLGLLLGSPDNILGVSAEI